MKTCITCKQELPLETFTKQRQYRRSVCTPCRQIYARNHYAANKTAALAKTRRRALVTRKWLSDYLSEHPCVDCGETDLRVLDFDHRDPATKTVAVSRMMGYSPVAVEAEVLKCDVRCSNCHRKRTAVQFNWWSNSMT